MNVLLIQSLYRAAHIILLICALWSLSAESSTDTNLIVSVDGEYSQHQLSADGRYLVYTQRNKLIDTLWSVTTDGQQAPVKLASLPSGSFANFVISPDGQTVAYLVVTTTLPLPKQTLLTGKSEHLYTVRLDGSRSPLLFAEGDIHVSRIHIDPADHQDSSQPPPSAHVIETFYSPTRF